MSARTEQPRRGKLDAAGSCKYESSMFLAAYHPRPFVSFLYDAIVRFANAQRRVSNFT